MERLPRCARFVPFTGPSNPSPSGTRGFAHYAPLLLPFAILLSAGFYALDFGRHWDEDPMWLKPLERSLREGAPLPGRYNYPAFGYWLTALAAVPEASSP